MLTTWEEDKRSLPTGFKALQGKARIYRAHQKLISWEFFRNLTIETVTPMCNELYKIEIEAGKKPTIPLF